MKNTYTIQEGKVYDVCKNGSPVKSFPTLEKAEEYKRQKEEEENGAKKCDIKTVIAIVLLAISALGIFIARCFHVCNQFIASYFISLFCGLIIGSCALYFFIKFSMVTTHYHCKKRFGLSFLTNMLFLFFPTMFITYNTNIFKESYVFISTLMIFILTFIFLCKFIEINKGDDISLLKATNYLAVFFFTAIKHLSNKGDNSLIDGYYLLPLILAQALYEIFDGKSKENDENKATPIQSQEEQK